MLKSDNLYIFAIVETQVLTSVHEVSFVGFGVFNEIWQLIISLLSFFKASLSRGRSFLLPFPAADPA